jgi:phosphate-selective porin OprO/OprP
VENSDVLTGRVFLSRVQWLARRLCAAAVLVALIALPCEGQGQTPDAPAPGSAPALQRQIDELRAELHEFKSQSRTTAASAATADPSPPANSQPAAGTFPPPSAPADWLAPADANEQIGPLPIFASYRYNFGGGYTQLSDADEEFSVKLQNQVTLDGTFYSQPNMPTSEKGFNIPFYRTYLYGNITRDWDYQLAVQGFLGQFNVLDAWINYTVSDALHIRAGRMLSPFLYEYWAFSPAWEPVITNSLLFQVAGKRQMGVMAWGQLAQNRAQYQAGVFTGIEGGFYDLDRNVDFLGSFTLTPWKGTDDRFENLGAGISVQTGMQNYPLNAGNTDAFINGAGEPTLNFNYINSTGIPFFQYNDDVVADGVRTKFAPHIFWYGRFSVQAEYLWQRRRLADATTKGSTILQGYQTTFSYLLTGERHTGDGLGGWTTVQPRSPFSPSRGQYGPGAWELAFQYSEIDVGTDNFKLGFADPATSTNRIRQTMLGLNWWPNKYTRLSFDWMYNSLNRPVPTGGQPLDHLNTYWTRAAMFF